MHNIGRWQMEFAALYSFAWGHIAHSNDRQSAYICCCSHVCTELAVSAISRARQLSAIPCIALHIGGSAIQPLGGLLAPFYPCSSDSHPRLMLYVYTHKSIYLLFMSISHRQCMHSPASAPATSTPNVRGEVCSICGASFPDLAALISHCEVAHQETPPPQPEAAAPVVMGTIVPERQHRAPGSFESWSRVCSGTTSANPVFLFVVLITNWCVGQKKKPWLRVIWAIDNRLDTHALTQDERCAHTVGPGSTQLKNWCYTCSNTTGRPNHRELHQRQHAQHRVGAY